MPALLSTDLTSGLAGVGSCPKLLAPSRFSQASSYNSVLQLLSQLNGFTLAMLNCLADRQQRSTLPLGRSSQAALQWPMGSKNVKPSKIVTSFLAPGLANIQHSHEKTNTFDSPLDVTYDDSGWDCMNVSEIGVFLQVDLKFGMYPSMFCSLELYSSRQ